MEPAGEGRHVCSQVRLKSGRWVCVATLRLPSGRVILQILLRQPMSEPALDQWSELLREVLQPARAV